MILEVYNHDFCAYMPLFNGDFFTISKIPMRNATFYENLFAQTVLTM